MATPRQLGRVGERECLHKGRQVRTDRYRGLEDSPSHSGNTCCLLFKPMFDAHVAMPSRLELAPLKRIYNLDASSTNTHFNTAHGRNLTT